MRPQMLISFLFSIIFHFVLIFVLFSIPIYKMSGNVPGIIILKLYQSTFSLKKEKGIEKKQHEDISSSKSNYAKQKEGRVQGKNFFPKKAKKIGKRQITSVPFKDISSSYIQERRKDEPQIFQKDVEYARKMDHGKEMPGKTEHISEKKEEVIEELNALIESLTPQRTELEDVGNYVEGSETKDSQDIWASEELAIEDIEKKTDVPHPSDTVRIEEEIPGSDSTPERSLKIEEGRAVAEKGAEKLTSMAVMLQNVNGDLKLEVRRRWAGKGNLKINILFREFSRNRRSVPFQRYEIENDSIVVPLIVNYTEDISLYVVRKTMEGVYYIFAEASDKEPVEAEFLLKLSEGSTISQQKVIGIKKIEGKILIARVLMPEGILWDDDSYFSGIIEDSESVTKFNTSDGLVWKEYKY